MRTVFPYGLNDRVGDDFMRDQANDRIGLKFPTLKRNFDRVGRRNSRKGSKGLNHKTFLEDLAKILESSLKEALNFIRMALSTMKKIGIKAAWLLHQRTFRQQTARFCFFSMVFCSFRHH